MKEIDERATLELLALLDREIDSKCIELKGKQRELKHKKAFFLSCLIFLISFLVQMFFNIFNVNLLFAFFIYQAISLIFTTPIIFLLSKEEYVNE